VFSYALSRLVSIPIGVFVVVSFAFILVRLVPGDPASLLVGELATQSAEAAIRERWGLDRPAHEQFVIYWSNFIRGDLGTSIGSSSPVATEILRVLPHTLLLTAAAAIIALLISIPLAIMSAIWRNTVLDRVISAGAVIAYSAPIFWLAIALMLFFGLRWQLLPVAGAGSLGSPYELLRHLVLPASALGLQLAGMFTRVLRTSLIEISGQDFTRTARSKGLGRISVVMRHSFRNAAIPLVTVVGLSTGSLLGGAILTETIFARPGLGRLLVNGILMRDYPMIQGGLAVFGALFIALNVLVDLLYPLIDPRIEVSS